MPEDRHDESAARYLARRAAEERAAAENAADNCARQAHLEMAERYAEQAQQARPSQAA